MPPWVCDFTRNTSPVGEIQDVYLCLWSDIMLCFNEMAPWVCDFTRNTSPVGEIQDVYFVFVIWYYVMFQWNGPLGLWLYP